MGKPYTVRRFATTADLGIHVSADSTPDLLRGAADGMFSTMLDMRSVPFHSTSSLTIHIDNSEELPIAFLNHLLYLFGAKGLVPLTFSLLDVKEDEVSAEVEWGKISPETRFLGNEVKAVTYSLYRWERMPGKRQRLRIVFDV